MYSAPKSLAEGVYVAREATHRFCIWLEFPAQ
jgi:hypothetical protein